ncbi:hypothetical protein DI09_1p550 [Mitosporidium daphniae]|uniref:Uncharacterized protein n=1 Tax=Mitosporidium daphniae TaxID=1485682 RepID=A0A098VTA2_9MICR|nr:uncharacterized protein DI09_1p550 [Mitosporidium daphniae]KGG52205.1 hypothetical protein DI09_1p550 [Mitosporidium daphniae]|eukprot:XP_013238632.1 uncharacterized protein DI09_1p550 [Mitosporidium daphniae]
MSTEPTSTEPATADARPVTDPSAPATKNAESAYGTFDVAKKLQKLYGESRIITKSRPGKLGLGTIRIFYPC